ncbi:MAG TPA: hypothetical protein VFW33_02300 [Gemmataceae bacterium]|nr:hypothetical protein [Gemmataceae bacterium]
MDQYGSTLIGAANEPRSDSCAAPAPVEGRAIEALAWLALALVLVVNVPLFLCMPLCADATLYDLAARNVLRGGVHYRDVFETNLPGMVWLHAAARSVVGWRPEALRLVDLAVVAAIFWQLARWLRLLGLSRTVRVVTVAALFLYYFSLSEWCHCQRDVWMLLPALGALELRRRQLDALTAADAGRGRLLLRGVAEGALWAAAFWIKPFVAVPALACWLVAAGLVWRRAPGSRRRLAADLAAVGFGGLVIGGSGVAWLVGTGAWPYFLDVFTNWNPEYLRQGARWPLTDKAALVLSVFKPWGYLNALAVPLALFSVVSALWKRDGATGARVTLALPGALYLGWLAQVLALQRPFHYCLAPLVPLAVTLLIGGMVSLRRLRAGRRALLSMAALFGGAAFLGYAISLHPAASPPRLSLWGRCLREGGTPELRDRLRLVQRRFSTDWADLERVADELRRRGAGDGEVTCYHDSTHPLYLELGIEPPTPYLHFGTVLGSFPGHRREVRERLIRSRHRYVVSDLFMGGLSAGQIDALAPGQIPDVPGAGPGAVFPWHLPIVFRAGRYAVHEATGEVGPLSAGDDPSP